MRYAGAAGGRWCVAILCHLAAVRRGDRHAADSGLDASRQMSRQDVRHGRTWSALSPASARRNRSLPGSSMTSAPSTAGPSIETDAWGGGSFRRPWWQRFLQRALTGKEGANPRTGGPKNAAVVDFLPHEATFLSPGWQPGTRWLMVTGKVRRLSFTHPSMGLAVKTHLPHTPSVHFLTAGVRMVGIARSTTQGGEGCARRVRIAVRKTFTAVTFSALEREPSFYLGLCGPSLRSALQGCIA